MTAPLTFRTLDAATWGDLERLFEARGGPSHCWCMGWRQTPEESHDSRPASRKRMLSERVEAGVPLGIMAYRGDDPVLRSECHPDTGHGNGEPPPRPHKPAARGERPRQPQVQRAADRATRAGYVWSSVGENVAVASDSG